jgi:hypothetical protein
VPQFHTNDRILVPQYWTVHGRISYQAARVLDVSVFREVGDEGQQVQDDAESDSGDFIQLTLEYDDNPGEEVTLTSHEKEYPEVVPWNRENLLRVEHDDMDGLNSEILQRASEESPETLMRWLKMVAENRLPDVFSMLTSDPQFANLPYGVLGPQLLRLALLPSKVPVVNQFRFAEGVTTRDWANDMDQLVTSICDLCGMDFCSFTMEAAAAVPGLGSMDDIVQGATLTTWEHVAAQRDDSKLLVWLLDHHGNMFRERRTDLVDSSSWQLLNPFRCRHLDNRGRNPLHVAALHGSTSIVETYREAEAQKVLYIPYFQSLFDFYDKDADGRTVKEMLSNIENVHDRKVMKTALVKLLRQIYQGVLDRALAPDGFDVCPNAKRGEK